MTEFVSQLRAVTLYHRVIEYCKNMSNNVKPHDETIFIDFEDKASELGRLRRHLVEQGEYNRATTFMSLELSSVQGPKLKHAVAAAFNLCIAMEKTQIKCLLYQSARLGRQIAGILVEQNPQLGGIVSQKSTQILRQIFPCLAAECPRLAIDDEFRLLGKASLTEIEKAQKFIEIATQARESRYFICANQSFLEAQELLNKNWRQCRALPSAHTALGQLHSWYRTYINFHREHSGSAFYESTGVAGYMSFVSLHFQDNHGVLQVFNDFQRTHPDFEIPHQQEAMFRVAASAAQKLKLDGESRVYNRQRFVWFKQCAFSDQWGILTESAQADPDQYILQTGCGAAADPVQWGDNSIELLLTWVKLEWRQGLLTAAALRELLGFVQTSSENVVEDLEDVDYEDISRALFGTSEDPSPSSIFLITMQHLVEWLNLPDRPPSRAARLMIARIIMQSRIYRFRKHLILKGFLDSVDFIDDSEKQNMLLAIGRLEDEARGGFSDHADRQMASQIQTTVNKCFVRGTSGKHLVTDEELSTRASECAILASRYGNSGRNYLEYHMLVLQGRLTWQRFLLFKSVSPDTCLQFLEQAEVVFNDIKRQLRTPGPAESLSSIIDVAEYFNDFSKLGVMASFAADLEYRKVSGNVQRQGESGVKVENPSFPSYERFISWTHRSKGRGLIDLLYLDFDLVADRFKSSSSVEVELSPSVDKLHISERVSPTADSAKRVNPYDSIKLPATSPIDISGENTVSSAMINEMLGRAGGNVVLVDIVNVSYLDEGGLYAILYRHNTVGLRLSLPNITLDFVERWVELNYGKTGKSTQKPLLVETPKSSLEELAPLLKPLLDPGQPQRIKAGEVIVFCLTGAMHRVPMHAIPVDGKALIEDYPVAYCQSLATLYHGYENVRKVGSQNSAENTLAIMPSYDKPWMDDPQAEEALQLKIEQIPKIFNATAHIGNELSKEGVQSALSECNKLFYFGHVHYDAVSPIHSALLLNEAIYKNPSLEQPGAVKLTVRDLFKIRLPKPALAILIGCSSGECQVSALDDLLGFPSALLFAGASAIVSTLWSIDPDDGADFAIEFFKAFIKRQHKQDSDDESFDIDRGLKGCVNLARIMYEAIGQMRQRVDEKKAPYHWAAFYLTGFWLFPTCNNETKPGG